MKKRLMIWLVVVPLILLVLIFLSPYLSSRPDDLGIKNGRLKAVPSTPNCVSSFADSSDSIHYISPVSFSIATDKVMVTLKQIIENQQGMTIFSESPDYLHIEAKTRIIRYTDDLEIYIDNTEKLIHFRSASRIGSSDLGANRKRVERLKRQLKEKLEQLN